MINKLSAYVDAISSWSIVRMKKYTNSGRYKQFFFWKIIINFEFSPISINSYLVMEDIQERTEKIRELCNLFSKVL